MDIVLDSTFRLLLDNEDILDKIHDDIYEYISTQIEIDDYYSDLEFVDQEISGQLHNDSFDSDVKLIKVFVKEIDIYKDYLNIECEVHIDFKLYYGFSSFAYDSIDKDFVRLGSFEKEYNKTIILDGKISLGIDFDEIIIKSDPIKYPKIGTNIYPAQELFSEPELDESEYLSFLFM